MDVFKDRLLISSPNSDFLTDTVSALRREYEVQIAKSADMALFLCGEWDARVCLIDGDSVAVESIQGLREKYSYQQLGMIVLCKDTSPHREERAFRAGCDHFIAWPTDERVLLLRIQSLIKRMGPVRSNLALANNGLPAMDQPISFGGINIFPKDFLIKRGEMVIAMSPTQFRLLLIFLCHKEQLLSRQWIKDRVWDRSDISTRSIDAQVSKLKKLLPELENSLLNIYGKGYILTESKRQAA